MSHANKFPRAAHPLTGTRLLFKQYCPISMIGTGANV